ncbi:toxin-antitoxin system HicB family antitoxin [Roseimaritima ulvae]|uniref:HicB family protein n=1 Tax=Roseimaritima ulvae TaxID=980254 RepID=A0A5B9QQM7_9BACT|nr:toxin-antitoxin system HicB family antitoxin [Roseimaritima ulvae]QEG39950.1 hypothetical protein UC8_19530 [Roseimaritima ulvae]
MNESRSSATSSPQSDTAPSSTAAAGSHTGSTVLRRHHTTTEAPSSVSGAAGPTPSSSGDGAAASPSAMSAVRLNLSPINYDLEPEQRADEVIRLAQEAFPQTGKWVLFYREILGSDGVARKLFPKAEQMRAFEQTPQFEQLLEMTAAMRSQDTGKGDELEPQKMITVRLPKSQHEAMKTEAKEHGTSINKLCISKLLLPIKGEFIPKEKGKVRGRKPGPQGPNNRLVGDSQA